MASNLIGNALKHGDPGGPVVVRVDGTGAREVSLVVANTGTIARTSFRTCSIRFAAGDFLQDATRVSAWACISYTKL